MLRLPHFRWKPERVTMSSFRESEFFCKRGHLIIRGTAFLPIKSCKGVVIVSHGLNQNRKPFYEYGQVFSAFGYAVFTFDFCGGCPAPGCESDGSHLTMSGETECLDLMAVIAYVRGLPYMHDKNIFLLGYSQGGFVSALVAARNPQLHINGLILLSPAFCIPDHARAGKLAGGSYDVQNVPMVISGGVMPVGKNFHDTVFFMDIWKEIRDYHGDVLLVHGKKDSVVNYRYAEKARMIYGPEKCRLMLMDSADHCYTAVQQDMIYEWIREFLTGKC